VADCPSGNCLQRGRKQTGFEAGWIQEAAQPAIPDNPKRFEKRRGIVCGVQRLTLTVTVHPKAPGRQASPYTGMTYRFSICTHASL
jgi:hypothetical protein